MHKLLTALSAVLLLGACATHPALEVPPTVIELDRPFEANLAADEVMRCFSFSAEAGLPLHIKVETESFYSDIRLYRDKCRTTLSGQIAAYLGPADIKRSTKRLKGSQLRVTLPPVSGDYYLLVDRSYNTPKDAAGPYRIVLSQAEADGVILADALGAIQPPRADTSGRYLMPFTEDGTVAPWVEKGLEISVGAKVGQSVAMVAGQAALNVATWGAAANLGKDLGAAAAIRAVGGWEFIRANSDGSYDNNVEFLRYMNANFSKHPDYQQVLKFLYAVYPELPAASGYLRAFEQP